MFALQIGPVTNHLLPSEQNILNWQTSGFIALWGRVYNKYSCSSNLEQAFGDCYGNLLSHVDVDN